MKQKSNRASGNLLIYVVNNYSGEYHIPFTDLGTITSNPEDLTGADLVVFTGGEDVTPSLYGEDPHPFSRWNLNRDLAEKEIFETALFHGIPMTGICRGSQFLNVMNGGKLIQHLEHHPSHQHSVITEDGELFISNTLHHQASIADPGNGMTVLAQSWPDNCVESFYYAATNCLGVQWHPEMMDQATLAVQWYKKKVRELLGLEASSDLPLAATH